MRFYLLILILFFSSCSCNNEQQKVTPQKEVLEESELAFDRVKWNMKEGVSYPYREQMLNNVIYNDSLRALNQKDVIAHLGEPSRVQDNYVYYLLEEKKVLMLTLTARTLVIKFNEEDRVEWMKIHE